ncbi:MAG: hypothetical protein GY757_35500 [bacterium]|nr:hypothetical protein [bacterium]
MSHLKENNLDKCFTLLREYLDEAPPGSKNQNARLALNQLQIITAGKSHGNTSGPGRPILVIYSGCNGIPKADAGPTG